MESQPESPEIEYAKRRAAFEEGVTNITEDYKEIVEPLEQELRNILDKARKRLGEELKYTSWEEDWGMLSDSEKERVQYIEGVKQDFDRRTYEFYEELTTSLSRDPFAKWERIPESGVEGSISSEYSQEYRTQLGKKYNFYLSWYGYPRRTHSFLANPNPTQKETQYINTQDESYYAGVKSANGKNVYLNGDGSIQIEQVGGDDNDREFYFNKRVAKSFDPETLESFKQNFLMLGRKLQDELGYPGKG